MHITRTVTGSILICLLKWKAYTHTNKQKVFLRNSEAAITFCNINYTGVQVMVKTRVTSY